MNIEELINADKRRRGVWVMNANRILRAFKETSTPALSLGEIHPRAFVVLPALGAAAHVAAWQQLYQMAYDQARASEPAAVFSRFEFSAN